MICVLPFGHHQMQLGFLPSAFAPECVGQDRVNDDQKLCEYGQKASANEAVHPKVDRAKEKCPKPCKSGAFVHLCGNGFNFLFPPHRFINARLFVHTTTPDPNNYPCVGGINGAMQRLFSRVLPGVFPTRVIRALFCAFFLSHQIVVGCGCCCRLVTGHD